MARRRKWPFTVKCAEGGCAEKCRWEYSSRRELIESFEFKRYSKKEWFCVRHSNKKRVLSLDNRSTVWESDPCVQEEYGKFFGRKGVLINDGFYASAEDFPVGTKIRITAEVIVPENETVEKCEHDWQPWGSGQIAPGYSEKQCRKCLKIQHESEANEAKLVEEVAGVIDLCGDPCTCWDYADGELCPRCKGASKRAILKVAEWVDTKASKATQECEAYHMHYYAQELRAMCAEGSSPKEGGEE